MPRPPGFTLLELLVVLVMMTGAVGLVATRFDGALEGMELRAAARELASGLRHVRGRAIGNQQEAAVVLNVEERAYRLAGIGAPREHRLSPDIHLELVTDRASMMSAEEGMIRFFPDGSSTGGRIVLSSGAGRHAIDVHWLTGRVQLD